MFRRGLGRCLWRCLGSFGLARNAVLVSGFVFRLGGATLPALGELAASKLGSRDFEFDASVGEFAVDLGEGRLVSLHPLTERDWSKVTSIDVLLAVFSVTELARLLLAVLVEGAGLAVVLPLRDLGAAGGVEAAVFLDAGAAGVVDVVGHVGESYLGAFDVVVGDLEAELGDACLLRAHPTPHERFQLLRGDGRLVEDFSVDDDELGERLASEDFERHC